MTSKEGQAVDLGQKLKKLVEFTTTKSGGAENNQSATLRQPSEGTIPTFDWIETPRRLAEIMRRVDLMNATQDQDDKYDIAKDIAFQITQQVQSISAFLATKQY